MLVEQQRTPVVPVIDRVERRAELDAPGAARACRAWSL
jgi:hypothetical protein